MRLHLVYHITIQLHNNANFNLLIRSQLKGTQVLTGKVAKKIQWSQISKRLVWIDTIPCSSGHT